MEGVAGGHLQGGRRQETAELATGFEDLTGDYEAHQGEGSVTCPVGSERRGDGGVEYKKIIDLMSVLQSAGAENVGLLTSPKKIDK